MALSFIGGILTSKDSTITALQNDEQTMKEAIRKNIYIVNTTVNNFQREIKRISENEDKYYETLHIIANHLRNLEQTQTKELVASELMKLKLHFIEIAVISLDHLNTLQTAILFAKRRIVHPSVISTRTMREYLYNIHVPKVSMLPIEIQPDTSLRTVQKYAEICEIETEIIGKNLVFAIALPLIENNEYRLYELIPYPYADSYPSLVYHTILPKNKYLILSTKTNRYTMTDTLEKCITIAPIFSLCQLHDLNGVSNGPCEVGLRYEDVSRVTTECSLSSRNQKCGII